MDGQADSRKGERQPEEAVADAPRWTGRGAGLLIVALTLHGFLTSRFWWVTDDAYISFRYARNLAEGHGLRFNLWEQAPVEGYSNFLWVSVAAGVHALGLDMVRWMPVLSWLCAAGLLVLLFDRLIRSLGVSTAIAGVAVIGLACYPPFALWSTSGLATMPFALLLFLTFDRLALGRGGPDALRGSLFGICVALIRVEGLAWVGLILILTLLGQLVARRVTWAPLLKTGTLVGVAFAIHLTWRHGYYGEWLPNTVYAKQVSGPDFLRRGYHYVMANALTFLVPFAVLPGLLVALRPKRLASGIGVGALALAVPVYAAVVSGDYMPMGRFLIPGIPFMIILVAWILQDLAGEARWRRAPALVLGAMLFAAAALPAWDRHLVPEESRSWCNYRMNSTKHFASEYQRWVALDRQVRSWSALGRQLTSFAADQLEAPVTMAVRALGAIGYETDFSLYDCAGLSVPEIARREVTEWKGQPGHDKAVELPYFLDRNPTILGVTPIADDGGKSVKRLRDALQDWKGRKVRAQYRPQMVKMTPADGDSPSVFLLLVVRAGEGSPMSWRDLDFMRREGLDKLPELQY